ncbi:MAG: hypothetical protein Q7S52_05010 [bacterium]|nr:hypothetical protein [bacterium]
MPQKYLFPALGLLVLIATGVLLFSLRDQAQEPEFSACTMEAKLCPDGSAVGRTGPNCEFAECPVSPVLPPNEITTIVPYGNIMLRPEETVSFVDLSITLVRVADDSRCAEDVTCIWAGTLHAELEIVTSAGKSKKTLELGQMTTIDGVNITLLSATPYPKSDTTIAPGDYRLTLSILAAPPTPKPIPGPKPSLGECVIGGCSGEICSDKPDMASICIYREEYACYRTATCERQLDGMCGWNKTKELESCLANPSTQ